MKPTTTSFSKKLVEALVEVGEARVIDAHEMEDGRMQVITIGDTLGGFEPEIVTAAVGRARFDASPDHPSHK